MRSGANRRPIAGNVARKCRSAPWQRRGGFCFFSKVAVEGGRGALTPPLSVPRHPRAMEGKKGKNHGCGPCTFLCSGTSRASWLVGLMVLGRGTLEECGTDVEDTERRFHVGDVGMGVVVRQRGGRLVRGGCVWKSFQFCCQIVDTRNCQKKKP